MKKNSPQKHFFRHKVRHIWLKKLLLLTLVNEWHIYWKRLTRQKLSNACSEHWNSYVISWQTALAIQLILNGDCGRSWTVFTHFWHWTFLHHGHLIFAKISCKLTDIYIYTKQSQLEIWNSYIMYMRACSDFINFSRQSTSEFH